MRRLFAAGGVVIAVAASAGVAAATTQPVKVQAGKTSTVSLPASNILARCTPPGEFHPNPTVWTVNPPSVKVSGLPRGVGMPAAGSTIQVSVPRNLSPFQPITISWVGNTKCVSFNGSITLKVDKSPPPPPPRPHTDTCVGPTEEHTRLMAEPWKRSPVVKAALTKAHAKFQSNEQDAPRPFAFDRFAITIDKMPQRVTPEQFLERFAADPNGTIKSGVFDSLTKFHLRGNQAPKVGSIYDIRIPIDDGSVVIVEKKSDHFIVQTIETPPGQTGRHPVSGAREFGFTKNPDGSVTFYTEGADRPDIENRRPAGWVAQNATWSAMMRAIAIELKREGGKPRSEVPAWWRKDIKTAC